MKGCTKTTWHCAEVCVCRRFGKVMGKAGERSGAEFSAGGQAKLFPAEATVLEHERVIVDGAPVAAGRGSGGGNKESESMP